MNCSGDRSTTIGPLNLAAACDANRCARAEMFSRTGCICNVSATATPSKHSAAKVAAALSARTATAANLWIAGRIGVAGIEARPMPPTARRSAPVVESIAALADCIALLADADIFSEILADIDALLTS